MSSFKGMAILCFYSNGVFQGHCINTINHNSPYNMAGELTDHVDPKHNDCMDPDDFYKVLIRSNSNNTKEEPISLLLRRPQNNDAGGLSTHEHESEVNNGYALLFEPNQFLAGGQAQSLKAKYFSSYKKEDPDVVVCIGNMEFGIQE